MSNINEPGKQDRFPEPRTGQTSKRFALPTSVALISLALAFLVWDYSEILFASRHRESALELVTPDMRLTTAERELNRACYSTLYISESGKAPQLQVTTLRRLPWTMQILRRTIPGWDFPKEAIARMLAKTQFTIQGNPSGTVSKVHANAASLNAARPFESF